jgi:hypothetical protein
MAVRIWAKAWRVSMLMASIGCSRDDHPSAPTRLVGSGGSGGVQDCGPCVDVCRLDMLACAEDAVCDAVLQCADTCAAADRPCIDACPSSTPNGNANQMFKRLIGCVSSKCRSDCGF